MSQFSSPIEFAPYARPQVWGARRLATSLNKSLPGDGTYGESWELSGHPHHVSRVAHGPLSGRTLNELWSDHRRELTGAASLSASPFPLLVKYLDCHEQLSIQVHPNDATALDLLGEPNGKTEAWVVLHAEPGARVYAGLKPGATRLDLERALDAGTVDQCLHSFVPRPGDCLMLPAGTVHGVGGGVLMAEIQQSSDATFRLFDWNRPGPDGRPRALHRTEALRSIDWSAGPANPLHPTSIESNDRKISIEQLACCDYFRMTRYRLAPGAVLPLPRGAMEIWMVLAGDVALLGGDDSTPSRHWTAGATALIPASMAPHSVRANTDAVLLRTTLPAV